MPKISVVIPVYNALDDLKLCINSIMQNFNFSLGNIIIINDCSDENTTNYLRAFAKKHPDINVLENGENLGFIKTCNRGMKLAQGDIVILLNSDTKIPSEFCERIIKCFESDEKIGIASPIGSYTNEYFITPPKNYDLEKMNKILQKKHKHTYPLVPACEGFCYAIRKEVIEQQGFLDEIYGKGYHEEVDFSFKAITYGCYIGRNVFCNIFLVVE